VSPTRVYPDWEQAAQALRLLATEVAADFGGRRPAGP
jgi:hypothetical protein